MATVRVHAKRPGGFRRAGRLWTEAPTIADVDEATLVVLRAEPMLDVREAREDDLSAAEPGVLPTVGSLEAECESLRAQLAASRDAHAADAASLRELEAKYAEVARLANETVEKWHAAAAENDVLRKQLADLEEAATAPEPGTT